MKLIITAMMICLISINAIGCKANPEKVYVIGKDMESIISASLKNNEKTDALIELRERLDAPYTYKTELLSKKQKLSVHVDAKIIVPNANAIPVIGVGISHFSEKDAMQFAGVLFEDAIPIDPNASIATKEFYLRSIDELLEKRETGNFDGMKYNSIEEIDKAIQEYMIKLEEAPVTIVGIEPVYEFKELNDGRILKLRALNDDQTISSINIYDNDSIGFNRIEYYRDIQQSADLSYAQILIDSTYVEDLSDILVTTEAEAFALASQKIEALGLNEFVCSGRRQHKLDSVSKGTYELMFTRKFKDIEITYTNDDGTESAENADGAYAMPWMYEKVRVFIDDKGILSLIYNSPYEILTTYNENSSLLPFVQIQEVFETMILIVDNIYDTYDEDITCEYYIREAKLGLARVTEQNIGDQGLLIPVWDFLGYKVDSRGQAVGTGGYESLLTINAIDGSIIDRGLGY